MRNIDLSQLDPAVLYEFGRQMWAAFGRDYTTVTFHGKTGNVWIDTYEYGADGDLTASTYVTAYSEDIVEAVRKLGEKLAAAQENQEAA